MERNHGYDFAMGQYVPRERTRDLLKPTSASAVVEFVELLRDAGGMSAGRDDHGQHGRVQAGERHALHGVGLCLIFREAGVPKGVFNYVTGPGSTVGQELVDSPDVAGFVFTGSRDVGLGAYRTFSETFPEADHHGAGREEPDDCHGERGPREGRPRRDARRVRFGGQKCSACSRVLVDKRVEAFGSSSRIERRLRIGAMSVEDVDVVQTHPRRLWSRLAIRYLREPQSPYRSGPHSHSRPWRK